VIGGLARLRDAGLDGVELEYPYHSNSPRRFGADEEADLLGRVRAAALGLGLRVTRGSDCHTPADFQRVYALAESGGIC
jgi:hypothetical protein